MFGRSCVKTLRERTRGTMFKSEQTPNVSSDMLADAGDEHDRCRHAEYRPEADAE